MQDVKLACVTGYFCEQHNNPADFFLDVMHGEVPAIQPQGLHNFSTKL